MRNPFRRSEGEADEKALSASGGVVDAIQNSGWSPVPLLGSGARQRILEIFNRAQGANYGWLYTKSPALRNVIDTIVRDVGELDLRLFEEVSEAERQAKPDHAAALSMRYPNEYTTGDSFVRSLAQDYLIHDNAYALLAPGTGNQITLIRIPAYMVVVQGNSLFAVDNYRIWPQGAWTSVGSWGGSGSWIDVPPDQMLHWHGEHPEDPRIGLSHLDTLRGVIAEDAALQQATVELANAGLQEPSWVFRPLDAPVWSNAARAGFERDLENRMRSRNKTPVVFEEGMEMRSFGVSPHDAQMMELRRWALSQVASEYSVPGGKVGLSPPVADDETSYLADVLRPLCKNFCSMLNQRVLVRVYDYLDGRFEFDIDARMIGDDRLKALTSAAGVPILLRNEARAMINRPPVDGGDDPATPINVHVGDPTDPPPVAASVAAPKPGSQVMPIQDPNKPPQDGSYRTDQGATPVPSGNGGKALTESVSALPAAPGSTGVHVQLLPRRAADMERQRRNVDAFQGVVQKHFNRLERSLKAKAVTDWSRWDREFADDLDGALKHAVQAEGDVYAMKLASTDNFDMGQVQHYLRAMAEGAATAINDTVQQEIKDIGLDAAMSRAPQHVISAGTSLGARSTMWAREEAARQSGSYEQRMKTWVADTDRHAEFDGVTVPIGEDWPAGFAPGAAPGCACTESIS